MKAVNIIGIVLSPALFFLSLYYIVASYDAYWASWDYGYEDYYYYGPSRSEITTEGGLFTLVLTLFFVFLNIFNLVKVKTMTSKVLGIIGICFSGIALIVNLMMLAEPGRASYDETGPTWTILSIIMLAFCIVFLVQSVNGSKKKKVISNSETIDDFDDIV